MGTRENGEETEHHSAERETEPELDSEPARDPLSSSQSGIHLNEENDNKAKRATRVPKRITKKEITTPKTSRATSTKLQFNNKSSSNIITNSPKRSPKPNNTINNSNIVRKLSGKKQETEIKDILEETISITSEETKEIVDVLDEAPNCDQSTSTDAETHDREEENVIMQDQVHPNNNGIMYHELEMKMERMETELCEAGIVEFCIYSVVSEHKKSDHEVHTPARRLSRVYIYACENWPKDKIDRLTRNIINGLVIIAKSCGNDVSRLTFWLSNIIVLREIINRASKDYKERKISLPKTPYKLYDTNTFISSLEKMESWIFSRVLESVWWQVILPPMQSQGGKQSNNSVNLWINAFNNALIKLCPLHGGVHKCGCLKQVAKLVMDQCIERLDVAMFNAILRDSINEIPTDPISDPISNHEALPIPLGDFSFGSGAQLKNSIGNWSRSLNDMFRLDMKESNEDYSINDDVDDHRRGTEDMKYFPLLNELSELLMLPKDMLLEPSIREEVCPSFGVELMTMILRNFQPDEFCPDSVPEFVLHDLYSEIIVEETVDKNLITSIPCTAFPVEYRPPFSADVAVKVAEVRGQAAELDLKALNVSRAYTCDDDLDFLGPSLSSIIDKDATTNEFLRINERYGLLREIWSE